MGALSGFQLGSGRYLFRIQAEGHLGIVRQQPERLQSESPVMNTYMVLVGTNNGVVFVKERDFFVSQGGDKQAWGRNWKEVQAESIEHARELAKKASHP